MMPLNSLAWADEHPDNRYPRCHESCLDSVIRLSSARKWLWLRGEIPPELREVWAQARTLIPDWPGFMRLQLDEDQMESLRACEEELQEALRIIRQDFTDVTVENLGGGVRHMKATRDLKR